MRIGRYLLLIIFFVGFFIVFGNRGLLDNQRLKEKLRDLKVENDRFEAENGGLKREALLLREDIRYIEGVARNELGMMKKGDLVYRFMEPVVKKEEPAAATPPNTDAQPPQESENKPATQSGSPI